MIHGSRTLRVAGLLSALAAGAAAQLEAALPTAGLTQSERFGTAVAIDGTRVIVGSSGDDQLGQDAGSARVFERQGGAWVLAQKLLASDGFPADYFGGAVALDGDRALVGAWREGDTGAAYVFDWDGSAWIETARLKASDGAVLDRFGRAVALDGDRALVGARGADTAGADAGAAYVFDFSGGVWSQSAKLLAGDAQSGDSFGAAVAVLGGRALVGAPLKDTSDFQNGAGYVFDLQGSAWVETAVLWASVADVDDRLGSGVALGPDRALLGAPGFGSFISGTGAGFVFEPVGGVWTETAFLQPDDPFGASSIGGSVALDGDRAALGDEFAWTGASTGAVRVFELSGGAWSETFEVVPIDADALGVERFGAAVGLSGDLLVTGAPFSDTVAIGAGMAYVHDLGCAGAEVTTYCTGKANSEGCVPWIACAGGPPSAAGAFTVVGNDVLNRKPGLLFYGTSGRAALPWQGGTLCVQPGLQRTPPQQSGGNPPPNDCSGTYAFDLGAHVASGTDPALVPGATVNAQYWYRDPQDAQGSGLTNALELVLE